MTLQEKIQYFKTTSVQLKCMNKWEVLQEHADTWTSNGLSNLRYTEISRNEILPHVLRIKVDVERNGHWTDNVAGIDSKDSKSSH